VNQEQNADLRAKEQRLKSMMAEIKKKKCEEVVVNYTK